MESSSIPDIERIPEIERKFEVDAVDSVDEVEALPDLSGLSGVANVAPMEFERLVAVYFDTPDLTLARRRIVVRRRSGGHDSGWHVKLQAAESERTEFHAPLSGQEQGVARVPESLLVAAGIDVPSRDLVPIAVLRTDRRRHVLVGAGGESLGEFCADSVWAERVVGHPLSSTWREWELEASEVAEPLLGSWSESLIAHGATAAKYPSKLVRALGSMLDGEEPSLQKNRRELVGDFFARQRAQIIVTAAAVELGDPDAIHDLRVACRTVRAVALAIEHFWDSGRIAQIQNDCRWLAHQVGPWRDVHVTYAGIRALLTTHAGGAVSDEFSTLLSDEEASRSVSAEARAKKAIASEKFVELTERLARVVTSSSGFLSRSTLSEKKLCKKLLERDVSQMDRQLAHLRREVSKAAPSFSELHSLRKRVKRQRYLAEFCHGGLPGRSAKVALAARALQEQLGSIQDEVVIRNELKRLSLNVAHLPNVVEEIHSFSAALKVHVEEAREEFVALLSLASGPE